MVPTNFVVIFRLFFLFYIGQSLINEKSVENLSWRPSSLYDVAIFIANFHISVNTFSLAPGDGSCYSRYLSNMLVVLSGPLALDQSKSFRNFSLSLP
jgi:hypothetical protein